MVGAFVTEYNPWERVQVLLSDIKSEDLSADITLCPLVTGSARSCAITTPRRAYGPAAFSAY